jgi:hypothetical protein
MVGQGGLIRNGERRNTPGCTQEAKALLEKLACREREVLSPSNTIDGRWRGRGARLTARPAPPRQRWGARASDQDVRQKLTLRVQRLPKRFERRAGDRLPQQPMQGLTVLYALDNGRNIVRRLSKMRRDGFEDHCPRLLHLPLL